MNALNIRALLTVSVVLLFSSALVAEESFRVPSVSGELIRASHITDAGTVVVAVTDLSAGTRLVWRGGGQRPEAHIPGFSVSKIVHVREDDSRTRLVVQGATLSARRAGGRAQLLEIRGSSVSVLWDSSEVDIPSGYEHEPHLSVSPDGTQWALTNNVGDSRLIVLVGEFPSTSPTIRIVTDVDEKKSSPGGRAHAAYPTVHLFSKVGNETVFAVHWRGRTNVYSAAPKRPPTLRSWLWTGAFADYAISVPSENRIWVSRLGRWYEFSLHEALSGRGEIKPRRRIERASLGRGDFSRMTASGQIVGRVQGDQGRKTSVLDLTSATPRALRSFAATPWVETSPTGKYLLVLPKQEKSETVVRYPLTR